MTPNDKLTTALELFRKLSEKDQIICLENLQRLAVEQEKNLAAPV